MRALGHASALALSFYSSLIRADDAPCPTNADFCRTAQLSFVRDKQLPVMGGFDTGFVPQGSNLQVRLVAQVFASTLVTMHGDFMASWPEAITLTAPGRQGTGHFGIHYGAEIAAEGKLSVTVLGQTYNWTGPIPYAPQFDFQVDSASAFDPWAFDPGVAVSGQTQPQRLAEVDVTSFIGLSIPGLSGGFALDAAVELAASYRTNEIVVHDVGTGSAIATFTQNGASIQHNFLGGGFAEYDVNLNGEVRYSGTVHLIPTFYVNVVGQNLSIPVADLPVPFTADDPNFTFDPVRVHAKLPDIDRGDTQGTVTFPQTAVGATSAGKVTLRNVGEAKLRISAAIEGSTAFTPKADALTLAPSTSSDLEIRFVRMAEGPEAATLVITSNDPDEPLLKIPLLAESMSGVGPGGAGGAGGGPASTDTGVDVRGGCNCKLSGAPSHRSWIALVAIVAIAYRRKSREHGASE